MEHFQDLLNVVCWWVQTPTYSQGFWKTRTSTWQEPPTVEWIMGFENVTLTVESAQLLVPLWGDFRRSSARSWSIISIV